MIRHRVSRGNSRTPRSDCPIACTLDLIGDRWTLLVVRDLMMGKRRFSQFLASGEGIKTNILADRLKRLERTGLVERSRYQDRPPRYEYQLTEAGRDLSPVLRVVSSWGRAHLPALRERGSTPPTSASPPVSRRPR